MAVAAGLEHHPGLACGWQAQSLWPYSAVFSGLFSAGVGIGAVGLERIVAYPTVPQRWLLCILIWSSYFWALKPRQSCLCSVELAMCRYV